MCGIRERFERMEAVERNARHLEPCPECGWAMVSGTLGNIFCLNEHKGLIQGTMAQPLSSLEVLNTLSREERTALGEHVNEFRLKHKARAQHGE